MKTYLGIDVGSISTDFVLVNEKKEILASLYIRTEGDPITAVKTGLKKVKEQIGEGVEVWGVGTTGSARYLAGVIAGADLVKNEITSHAKASSFLVPEVRTIIEIGGQDSKIIILEDGVAIDFGMNAICLSSNSKITTNPNYSSRPIKEVKIGQHVLTHQGDFQKIDQVFERHYKGEMIDIEVSNLKKLEITPEHPILGLKRKDIKCYQDNVRKNIVICKPPEERTCKKRCVKHKNFSWEPKFIPAQEFRKGDFVATPLPSKIDNSTFIDYSVIKTEPKASKPFKKIDKFMFKPDLFRFLGYYLAEGSIIYNQACGNKEIRHPRGISFVFNINEKNYVKDIKNIISHNFKDINVKVRQNSEHRSATVSIYSKSLADYVKYLCGSCADKKQISRELLKLEPSLQKEILKGFFRGDGRLRKRPKNTLGKNKIGNRYVSSTVSEVLAHQLYWILLRNKIKCTLRRSFKKTTGGKYVYFISVHGRDINKLEDGSLINPKKQSSKSFIYSNFFFEPIRKISKYKFNGNIYNFKVAKDDSYVVNNIAVHNCAAGTGSFLDAQSFRLEIPIEKFGEVALKSNSPTTIASRCTIFAESDMIHKQQIGHKTEDIVAGLCQGLARNYLAGVGKGKNIQPPIVFQGGVSENKGMIRAFEQELGEKVIVPEHNIVMGALGVALLAMEQRAGQESKGKFRGWDVSNQEIKTSSFTCDGCPNQCEVIEARINGKVVSRWGDRCGKWSNLRA
jgi:activator of 2-hydroxyglutaryl-CoA dehydratase